MRDEIRTNTQDVRASGFTPVPDGITLTQLNDQTATLRNDLGRKANLFQTTLRQEMDKTQKEIDIRHSTEKSQAVATAFAAGLAKFKTDSSDSLDGIASISTRDGEFLSDLCHENIDDTDPQLTTAPQATAQCNLEIIPEDDAIVEDPGKKWATVRMERDGMRQKQPSDSGSHIPNDSQASDHANSSALTSETEPNEDKTANSALAKHNQRQRR